MTQPLQFLGTATITSLATFCYYSAFVVLAGSDPTTALDAKARAIASVVVGALLTVRARQRDTQTVAAAAADGFVLGVIVVVCNSLFGSEFAGRELAIRTAGILTGVPLLAAISQVLDTRLRLVQQR